MLTSLIPTLDLTHPYEIQTQRLKINHHLFYRVSRVNDFESDTAISKTIPFHFIFQVKHNYNASQLLSIQSLEWNLSANV